MSKLTLLIKSARRSGWTRDKHTSTSSHHCPSHCQNLPYIPIFFLINPTIFNLNDNSTDLHGGSRQCSRRIRCHSFHLPMGNVKQAYSYNQATVSTDFACSTLFFTGGDTLEQRSAADTLGFRPKPVTQVMVSGSKDGHFSSFLKPGAFRVLHI
jgi:hypothetical protein